MFSLSQAMAIVHFIDLQEPDSPLSGKAVESAASMSAIYQSLSGRKPFLFELRRDSGSMLTVGFSSDRGCVQYSSSDGSPPYFMAVSDGDSEIEDEYIQFLAGNTPTPIPIRYSLPMSLVERITAEFIDNGERLQAVAWEAI